ncbi:hypothetical protein HMI54_001360 [Coelomomyces lativittatus]|nr:hypothetical protein HMI56_004666 [Coelomomyces lativittatus]KAJ1516520.1 hypothetical protein HMI55_002061 [Coelomomyces lativittatus]KAJ1518311.1 hypothetical protein HMI54_001360 [Coelomomyces lativittatus]
MGLFTIVEIFSNFSQYLGIIGSIDVVWPESLKWIGDYLHFLRVDFTQTINLPNINLPSLDFRAQHIILINAFPLALAIILLVFFKSMRVVLWYCALLTSVGVLFTGLVLRFIPSGPFTSMTSISQLLCIVGGSCLVLCFLGFIFYRLITNYRHKIHPQQPSSSEDEELQLTKQNSKDIESSSIHNLDIEAITLKDRISKKSFWIQTRNFTLGSLLLFFGLLIAGVFPSNVFGSVFHFYYLVEDAFYSVGATIGWIMVSFGLALIYNWTMGHFAIARRFHTRLNYLFRKNFVKVVLALLGLLYVPMSTSIFSCFLYKFVSCPTGTELVHSFVRLDLDSLITTFTRSQYTGVACKSCYFNNNECPIASKLCPGESDLRLYSDPSISYNSEILLYYVPGSILAVFSIIIGFPWLFYKLILISSRFVSELPVRRGYRKEERWKSQCKVTSSSCRSLYTMFEYKWRNYKLITLIHKLIVVAVFTLGGGNSFAVICALVASHSAFAIMSIYSRPYINKGEDILAIVCLFINVLNAVIALLVALGFNIPTYVSPIVITLNTVFPTATIILGLYFQYLEEKAERKLEEEKLARQIQAKLKTKKKKIIKNTKELEDNGDTSEDESSIESKININVKEKAKAALKIKKSDLLFIDSMDQELDQRLLNVLVNFFLFLGLVSFLSLAISILGVLLASNSRSFLYPRYFSTSDAPISTLSMEFAGYASWNEFITNCCCQYSLPVDNLGIVINSTKINSITEVWKCVIPKDVSNSTGNFLYKLRLRKYGNFDGTIVRAYCSTRFNSNLVYGNPTLNTSTDLVSLNVHSSVPSFIAENLW